MMTSLDIVAILMDVWRNMRDNVHGGQEDNIKEDDQSRDA